MTTRWFEVVGKPGVHLRAEVGDCPACGSDRVSINTARSGTCLACGTMFKRCEDPTLPDTSEKLQ